jgi:hypothetical protein
MASGQGLVVEGLKETRKRIKQLSPEADQQFKVAMRELANEVAGKAKGEAKRKRLVGDEFKPRSRPNLITGIKRGSVTMEKAEIKSTAFRKYQAPSQRGPYNRQRNRSGQLRRSYVGKDFAYPMVYEYGDRGRGFYGSRAFLNPALMKSQDMIEKAFLDAVNDASRKAGLK